MLHRPKKRMTGATPGRPPLPTLVASVRITKAPAVSYPLEGRRQPTGCSAATRDWHPHSFVLSLLPASGAGGGNEGPRSNGMPDGAGQTAKGGGDGRGEEALGAVRG